MNLMLSVASSAPSIPVWAWIFLVLVLGVISILVSTGLRRARKSTGMAPRAKRSAKGLSAEQVAFQQDMEMMLHARLLEKREVQTADDPPMTPGGGGVDEAYGGKSTPP